MVLASLFSYMMRVPENFRCSNIMKNTCLLLREFAVIVFLVAVFILGLFFGIINTFLFWYLTDLEAQSGGNSQRSDRMVVGLALFCAAGMELPTIFFSGKIIRLVGEVACISSAFAGYAIRFMAYYFIQVSDIVTSLIYPSIRTPTGYERHASTIVRNCSNREYL